MACLFHALRGRVAQLTLDAAEKNGIAVYDGAYLGLAMDLGAEFVTADNELIGRLTGEHARIARRLASA